MPVENIRFVVSGANPQTKTVQVTVDPTSGSATASFQLTGVNGGQDLVTAYMDSENLTSNTAQVNWQDVNGPISLGPVTSNFFSGGGTDYNGGGGQIGGPHTGNSLVFNQVYGNAARGVSGFPITGFSTTDGNTGAYKRTPLSGQQQDANGAWVSDNYYTEATGAFQANHQGSFVVTQAGTYSFYFFADCSWAFFLGNGASFVSGPQQASVTSKAGLPQMGARMGAVSRANNLPDLIVVNFPAAGIYPFEIGHATAGAESGQEYLVVTYSQGVGATPSTVGGRYGQEILPVSAIQSVPPQPSPGSGNLLLTPTGGSSNLLVRGSTVTLNLQVQNLHYTQKSYIPVLPEVTGRLRLYNSATSNSFTVQPVNGQGINLANAVPNIVSLSGDNSAWQGRLSVSSDGTSVFLNFNGADNDGSVASTNLTVTSRDLAWGNGDGTSLDLYSPTNQGGGSAFSVEVDYLVYPMFGSLTPTGLQANGATINLLYSLRTPMHPLQSGTVMSVSGSGGITVNSSTPNLDGSNRITGWTINVTLPSSANDVTVGLSVALSTPNLTILEQDVFATGTIPYDHHSLDASLALSGVGAGSSPASYSFFVANVDQGGEDAAAVGFTGTTAMQVTISASANSFGSMNMQLATNGGGFQTLQTASATNVRSSNGVWLADYYATFNTSAYPSGYAYQFGYNLTMTDGQPLNYVDTRTYTSNNAAQSSGGGGGGEDPGCPTLDMYVLPGIRVRELVNLSLHNGLADLPVHMQMDCMDDDFVTFSKKTPLSIRLMLKPCVRITATNGAILEVSENTPVPTREFAEMLCMGLPLTPEETYAVNLKLGMHVYSDINGEREFSRIKTIDSLGMMWVAKIDLGGVNFAAGADADARIQSHNSQIAVK